MVPIKRNSVVVVYQTDDMEVLIVDYWKIILYIPSSYTRD